jgi:hypothetical protein
MARTFNRRRTDKVHAVNRKRDYRLQCGDCYRVFGSQQAWYAHLAADGYCPALARVVNLHSGRISYA